MWRCSKCEESSSDTFAVCWHCGTDRHGKEDPTFLVDADVGDAIAEQEVTTRFQFGLRSIFVATACVALFVGFARGLPDVVVLSLAGIGAANLLGLIAGVFVTYVLLFPNDGSLSWNEDDETPSQDNDHN
ncbi:MAG: hypothetical protein H8E66_22345 [Planctomycetes bacterium]|nr:hypothetical protein [Planctomycetota bacterium]